MAFFERLIEGPQNGSPSTQDPPKKWKDDYSATSRRPHVGSTAPPVDQAVRVLRERIEALGKAGALDEGSGSFFDRMIASWVEQWHNHIDNEHEARQSELHLAESRIRAELARRLSYEEAARRELEEINQEIRHLIATSAVTGRPKRTRGWTWRLMRRDNTAG